MKKTNILKSGIILISFLILPGLLACNGKSGKVQATSESEFAAKTIKKSVGKIDVMVDPNVEMMMILGRLAGAKPYDNEYPADATYIAEVDEYFKDFKFDPAVIMLRSQALGYTYIPEFGMYLNDDDSDFIMKLDNKNFLVYDRSTMGFAAARTVSYYGVKDFREAVRNFRKTSDFDRFFLEHQVLYEKMIDKSIEYLNKYDFINWYEDFYGIKVKEQVCIYMTYMSGGGNFGITFRNEKGKVVPHIVVTSGTDEKNFMFLLSHEFSHPRTLPVVSKLGKNVNLINKFTDVYMQNPEVYTNNGYGPGYPLIGEMVNQACANKYLESIFDDELMERFNKEVILDFHKFIYTPQIADFLDNYINNRKRYKTLMDFEPELEKFLEVVEEN